MRATALVAALLFLFTTCAGERLGAPRACARRPARLPVVRLARLRGGAAAADGSDEASADEAEYEVDEVADDEAPADGATRAGATVDDGAAVGAEAGAEAGAAAPASSSAGYSPMQVVMMSCMLLFQLLLRVFMQWRRGRMGQAATSGGALPEFALPPFISGLFAPFAALQSKIETFARSPNAPPVMLFSMIVLLKLLKPRLMADEYSAGLGGEDEPVVGADDADSESPADEAEEAAVDDGDDEAGDVEVTFVNVTPIAEDAEGAG